jgi:membrane-bound serine protease (ClpP class)
MRLTVSRTFGLFAAACVCLLASAAAALAQEASDAIAVTVQNPITSDAVNRIKNQINMRLNEANPSRGQLKAVVFDFNPDGKPASTTDFGTCFELAEFIGSGRMQGLQTIAFVHNSVTGHTVLPILACKELVMRDKVGSIGPIVVEGVQPLDIDVRQTAYRKRFTRDERWPIVQKMFDPNVQLVKGKSREGGRTVFADARNEEALKHITGIEPVQGVQDGQLASYPAQLARSVELARGLAENRRELAELYGLPPLRDDPLQGRTPDAYQWTLKGDVDGAMRESVNRIIRDVRKKKGNVLILILNCGGTDLEAARGLADDLVKAQTGDEAIQIIAFVPDTAPDAAAVIALGCSDIVMTRPKPGPDGTSDVKEADFGNFDRYIKSAKPAALDAQKRSLREFAEQRDYPGVLIEGMLDQSVEILRVRGTDNNRNKTKLMTRSEFQAEEKQAEQQKRSPAWSVDKVIKAPGVPFHPNATLASELGLARFTVPTTNVKDVCTIYGVSDAKSPDPGWLDKFAEFLKIPAVTVILVMVGFIGLILELKVPGLTVPGIIAALCFILVFWSQSRFSGEMFVLALLLFILGLVLVGLEIFVLPGFGACGITGILCMLAGLGLVTLEKLPTNSGEWVGFGVRVSYYLFAMMGAMGAAFVIAKFLPQVPGANRLLLAPPSDQPNASEPVLPGASEALELMGAIGTTTTPLRPAGVVRFGDKFVDVVSDGGFIPSGSRVQVIAVEGTRIVVKEV